MIQLFGQVFSLVQLDTFYHHQDYEQIVYAKSRIVLSSVGPSDTEMSQLNWNWLENGRFYARIDEFDFSKSKFAAPLRCYAKKIENPEFVQGVNIEFIDSLKDNGRKYLLASTNHTERFAIQKRLLILLLLENIVD